jgi:DNA ligase (NAD+)
VAWRCVDKNSFDQQRRKFSYFVSKQALNIVDLGPKIMDVLLKEGLVSEYADIFTLEKGDLLALPRFAEKSVDNLLTSIEKARSVTLPRFIVSLSIPNVGEETAYLLADKSQIPISKYQNLRKEDLEKIEGVGPIVAKSIVDWFADRQNKEILAKLLKQIKISSEVNPSTSSGQKSKIFEGKAFVLTGTLSGMGRDEAKTKIRLLGGSVSSSVSKETDFVVAGENPGSKYEKALELGVKILNETEFQNLIS